MAVKLSDLTTESTPASNDILLIADPVTGVARKITVSALKTFMDGLGGGGDVVAPTIVSATASTANTITIVFSESVTVTTSGWSFKRNTVDWPISSVTGSGNTWTFTMSSSGSDTDTITRSYNSTTGSTVDAASNELVTFTDQSVTNSIPPVGPTLVDIDFTTVLNLAETSNVWAGSGGADYNNNKGVSTVKLASGQDGWVQVECDSTDGNDFIIQLKTTSTNDNYDVAVAGGGVYCTGTSIYAIDNNGNPVFTSPGSFADGNLVRVKRTGSVWTIEKSTDGGSTWPTVTHTLTTTTTADVYVHGHVGNTNKKIYNPKGFNIS